MKLSEISDLPPAIRTPYGAAFIYKDIVSSLAIQLSLGMHPKLALTISQSPGRVLTPPDSFERATSEPLEYPAITRHHTKKIFFLDVIFAVSVFKKVLS